MADDNAPIGGDLSAVRRAAQELEQAATEARAAAKAARDVGAEPSKGQVEREAARTRQREQAYEQPLSEAAQQRRQAEVEAAREARTAANQQRRATNQQQRATNGRVQAEEAATSAARERADADVRAAQAAMESARSQRLQLPQVSSAGQMQQSGYRAARIDPAALRRVADQEMLDALLGGRLAQQPSSFRERLALPAAGQSSYDQMQRSDLAYRRRGGVVDKPGTGVPPAQGFAPSGALGAEEQRALRAKQAYDQLGQSVQRMTSKISGSDNALRRHGALTTEFIEAAARGEASYREWGYQIGATAGKFAGWTAVSIPVFAALDGVRKIGQGAIQSASGVNQLQRVIKNVNPGDAQQAFRDLSSQFNVPIETATRAVYLAGQRFHNLGDAVDAARASLFAFKTGELDVDTATTQLNSVAAAFGLKTGVAVKDTFEQVNQAQNQLNASIPDLVSGLAKAGGAFRNSGGDVQGLITLLVSARQTAGRTGDQAATTFQRAAGYVRRPSNMAALRGFGINPDQPYYRPNAPSLVGQAVEVTKGLLKEGRTGDIQALATALSSPQFASVLVPILRASAEGRPGGLGSIAPIVSPAASRRSAENELAVLLKSPSEQLSAFGNGLERFGSALGESGMVRVLTTAVGAMSLFTNSVTRALSVFNGIPPALATITAGGAGLLGVRAVGRRVGLGENRGGALGAFFGRTDEQSARVAVNQAVRENAAYVQEASRGFATRARQTSLRAQVSLAASQEFDASTPEAQGMSRRAFDAQGRALRENAAEAAKAAVAMEAEVKVMDRLAREQAELSAAARRAAKEGTSLSLAEEKNLYVARNRPLEPGEQPEQVVGGRFTGATQRASSRLRGEATAITAVNATQGTVAAAGEAAARTATLATSGFRRLGAGLTGLRASIYGTIGGFGVALIGLDAAVAGGQALKDHFDRRAAETARLDAQANRGENDADILRRGRAAQQAAEERGRKLGNAKDSAPRPTDDQQADIDRAAAAQARLDINRSRAAKGKPLVDQTYKQVQAQLRRVVTDASLSTQERLAAIGQIAQETDISQFLNPSKVADLARQIATARRGSQTPTAVIEGLLRNIGAVNLTDVGRDIDNLAKLADTPGAKLADLQRLMGEGVAQLARGSRDTSVHGRAAYQARLDQVATGIEGSARNELTRSLDVATTQKQRDAAYDRYYKTLDKADDPLQRQLRQQTHRRQQAERALAQPEGGAAREGSQLGDYQRRYDKLVHDAQQAGADEKDTRKALSDIRQRIAQARREIDQQRYEEQDQLAQARTQVGQYNYAPGTARDSYLLREIGDRVKRAVAQYGRDSQQALSVIAEQQQAREQVVQDQLDTLTARGNLREAQITDPTAKAQAHIGNLQQQLAFARQHNLGEKSILDIQTQIVQARQDLAKQQVQDINALIEAQYALRESQTDDPVQRASLELASARAVVKRGHFDTPADKLHAQADVNDKARALRDARLQSREGDVDFELSMEKISVQDAIDKYNALLSIHNLSKAQRQQIQQRVHDLQKQADQDAGRLDLDVGAIRLPTIYDVRRAFDPIRASIKHARDSVPTAVGSSAQTTTGDAVLAGRTGHDMQKPTMAAPTFNITINDKNAAHEVFTLIDRALKTNVKSKMKSRGHR